MTYQSCRKTIFAVFVVCTAVTAGIWGKPVPSEIQINMSGSLLTIAAIILGVLGAWIAIVYPSALDSLNDVTNVDADKELRRLRELYPPIYISVIVIALLLLGSPFAIICESNISENNQDILRRVTFSALCGMSSAMIIALFQVTWPFIRSDYEVEQKAKKVKLQQELMRRDKD